MRRSRLTTSRCSASRSLAERDRTAVQPLLVTLAPHPHLRDVGLGLLDLGGEVVDLGRCTASREATSDRVCPRSARRAVSGSVC